MKRAIALATGACFLVVSSGGLAAVPQQPAGQSRLNINHDPLRCVSATTRPVVDAKVAPQNEMERGYVYFREKGSEEFYYVVMKPRPLDVAGELPRPLPGMKGMEYYVQATDVAQIPAKTSQYGPGLDPACSDPRSSTNTDGLTVGLTRDGQNPVPPGFSAQDIAKVILASGVILGLADAVGAFNASGGAAAGGTQASTSDKDKKGSGGKTALYIATGAALLVAGGLVIANNTGGRGGAPVSPSRPTSSRKD